MTHAALHAFLLHKICLVLRRILCLLEPRSTSSTEFLAYRPAFSCALNTEPEVHDEMCDGQYWESCILVFGSLRSWGGKLNWTTPLLFRSPFSVLLGRRLQGDNVTFKDSSFSCIFLLLVVVMMMMMIAIWILYFYYYNTNDMIPASSVFLSHRISTESVVLFLTIHQHQPPDTASRIEYLQ